MNKILLLLSILPLLVACESKTIQGRVVDLFGQPIEGVKVSVLNSGFTTRTDDEGYYELDYAPSNEIRITYFSSDTTQCQYDGGARLVSIVEKSRYPMPDVVLCGVPASSSSRLWLIQNGAVSELPRTDMISPTKKIEGPFTRIKRDDSIVYCFDQDSGKDKVCFPMLLSISEKTGRLVLNFSNSIVPFEGVVYDKITHNGLMLHVATIKRSDQIPKGRYVLCLLNVKLGKIAGTYHGVEIE